MKTNQWHNFVLGDWTEKLDVRQFINLNYTPYLGDESFLQPISHRTLKVFEKYTEYCKEERKRGGVDNIDTERISSLLSFPAGYIDKENEHIVGLQTAVPLKRAINPFASMRMAEAACKAYGYEVSDLVREQFRYKSTHNDGVFRAYTKTMRKLRHNHILTGLPDAYGRGRIIGDYRRIALYGMDQLIAWKMMAYEALGERPMTVENIQLIEEVYKQIDFMKQMKEMALLYDIDISKPASNTAEAVQWIYFGYLAAIKEQNGAAMSLGRVSTFIDIYAERDLHEGVFTEAEIQEIIDQFVIKLRAARQLRTPEYNELFAGDPTWVTEAIGGMSEDGRTLVTKTSYRFLNTLYNLSSSPEPNMTVLWSKNLPETFKKFCVKVSVDTSSIQYENDDLMRPMYGDDYGIACCVSAMKIGKQMQYFGARCNLPKVLLLAINGGRDEETGEQVGPQMEPLKGLLSYEEVYSRFDYYMKWIAKQYVETMNVIHFMHDKYCYEKSQMALHNTDVERLMAFGIAGLSVVSDSLSAIKYGKVEAISDETGLAIDYKSTNNFPKFGNDDDRVDTIASEVVSKFYQYLCDTPTIRNATHTLSLLTITSNVVYGKATGATPDGRKAGQPFAPGANPMHNREECGALASLNSVAKLNYVCCQDGISNTFSITPDSLGRSEDDRLINLVTILDGYFGQKAHHLNVNVLNRETLIDAQKHPEKYATLTIRVSGYAVNFNSLSKKHQDEVIARTFH
jgi:formate C-acetyltransferase